MGMLEGQANVKPQTPMPVERVDDSSVVTAVSGEAFVWYYLNSTVWAAGVGQAAGTIVWGKTTYDNVLNSSASAIGSYNDTSVSFAAATRAATKVTVPEEVLSTMVTMSPADQKATIAGYLTTAGDFCIDHRRGMVWLNSKAIVANDSISYSYKTQTTGGSAGDKVDIIKINGDAVAAANTARTTATKVVPTQNIGADGTVSPTGSLLTNAPFAKITDGTSNLTLGTGTVKTVPTEISDGTTGVDVIATVNSLKSDVSSIGGEVVVADNGAGSGVTKTIPVGGKYNATPPTYTDGDVAMAQFGINGSLMVEDAELGAFDENIDPFKIRMVGSEGIAFVEGTPLPNPTGNDGDVNRFVTSRYGVQYNTLTNSTGSQSAMTADDSAMPATPLVVHVGGEYRSADTTYTDGDATVLQTDVNGYLKVSPLSITSFKADDSAFSIGTDKVLPVGYLADETGTDSVDEGDVGLARMSLDRKVITAQTYKIDDTAGATDYGAAILVVRDDGLGTLTPPDGDYTNLRVNSQGALWVQVGSPVNLSMAKSDDAAFSVGSDSVLPIGYLVDDTASDSADEGDIGLSRMSPDRIQYMYSAVTSSATQTYSKDVSAALEASSVTKNAVGNFYRAFGAIDATAATDIYYIQVLDASSLPADGAVTHLITPIPVNHTTGADSSFDTGLIPQGVAAGTGIVVVLSTTMVTKTIAGAYLFGTVLYK